MSSPTSSTSNNSSATTSSISSAQSNILPYTEGLTGVNLWLNSITSDILYASLGLIVIVILSARVVQVTAAYLRFLATLHLTNDQQKYWTRSQPFWAKIKKHLLAAPLLRKRHNKEFQLSSAVNVGTIPSRLHTLFISFYILSNLIYCCILDYHHQTLPSLLAEARGRTGHLAALNMIPLFIFSARNNPFIPLLGISFDTFNLFHRWMGRLVVLEGLAHTFIWGVNNYSARGLEGLTHHLRTDMFLICGLITTVAMTTIVLQSVSTIRHAFYEFFLHFHQLLAFTAVVGLLLHCESQKLPQRPFVYALISIWVLERIIRLLRIFGGGRAMVNIEALDGGACRVTFAVRGAWERRPGRHLYAYIPTISLWMSHPFSIAWVEESSSSTNLKTATSTPTTGRGRGIDFIPRPKRVRTAVSCIIASRTGMTSSLYKEARKAPNHTLLLKAFIEGPYGGLENMNSYGTIMLFAGGVGITHQLSLFHQIVRNISDGTCSTRKVNLIWAVRTREQLEWVRPWLEEIATVERRGADVRVLLFVTRGEKEVGMVGMGLGMGEEVTFGRMDAGVLVQTVFEERVGAMCVGVCGPGGLADDVRNEVRGVMGRGAVHFWEECFTW